MRRSFLVCLITVAWSIPQVSAQATADSDVLLEQLASDSSHDREQAITEILRRRVELRTWLGEQAKGADAEVRDSINLVRKLIELGLTEKVPVQLRAYVERFIAGTFDQRQHVAGLFAGKHAHFLLSFIVPEIATTTDDRQREKLWTTVSWSLRKWSRGRAALAGTMIVEMVEENAVCSANVSRHGDVLVRYLQAVAKDDPKLNARFCVRMFRGANIDRIAATSPMLQTLLGELKRPNAELLTSILKKGSSGPFHIAKAGHGREIIDAVRSVSDPEQRWQLKKMALDSRPLRELMSADEIQQMSRSVLPGDTYDLQGQQRPGVPRDDSP